MLEESAQAICTLTGASLIAGDPSRILHAFTNDTRSVKKGSTFVCFVGERCDGNDFTIAAIETGAAGVIMCREATPSELACAKGSGACLLRTKDDDPDAFLQTLARAYRKREGWLTVGVTGSVGKTTTRQMLKAALSARFKTFSNEGNLNSVIGVPLTILNAPSGQEVFVCEMGMDHAGEIDTIASVALPNVGCITNIGTAHIGILGSQENIARAKAEMVRWISAAARICPVDAERTPEPALFLDEGDDFSDFIAQTFAEKEGIAVELLRAKPVTATEPTEREKPTEAREAPEAAKPGKPTQSTKRVVPENAAHHPYARFQDVTITKRGTSRFTYLSHAGYPVEVACPLLGEHMATDALFALAISEYVGCAPEQSAQQIEAMHQTALRAEMKTLPAGVRLIDDSYNANPASMKAALNLLESLSCAGKRIAVLGEMGELGKQAQELHEDVGAYAASKGFSAYIFVGGDNARVMYEAAMRTAPAKEMRLVANAEDARQALSSILESADDLILVKGSRFMALDAIAKEMNATC